LLTVAKVQTRRITTNVILKHNMDRPTIIQIVKIMEITVVMADTADTHNSVMAGIRIKDIKFIAKVITAQAMFYRISLDNRFAVSKNRTSYIREMNNEVFFIFSS
jgi:hypothetical protein